ncbi:MAG TPA: CoA transferase [Ramlibacter sp.]|uniref:CaiB/BaiF CoA transferase family protein n=1 Tax=Ramlibacter sp. TaxID=1917967 RepID=UPI002C2C4066|nr:CoA transferase [Ramlibacter sp.]HVZ46483.1 CoA transferase [Ramlibacter sp.]
MKPSVNALAGVKVLDLTRFLAGPFCTQLLSDHGADVAKVEPFEGDQARAFGLPPGVNEGDDGQYSLYFQSINRNKRSLALDLRRDEGKEVLRRMVAGADVLVENFRLGVMERLGLGYEQLREINPRLVYAAVRGFGDTRSGESPYSEWPCFDIIAQSTGGLLSITGDPDGTPTKVGPGIGDTLPGIYLAFGILAALHQATRTGKGQFVDVCMTDAILAISERVVYHYQLSGRSPKPEGNFHPFFCPYGLYRAADGWVSIACVSSGFWQKLAQIIGKPELGTRPDLQTDSQRSAQRDFVNAQVTEWTRGQTKKQLAEALGGIIPFGSVNTAEDIFADRHFQRREMLVEVESMGKGAKPLTLVNTPVKMSDTPSHVPTRAPFLGEHTVGLLAEYGFAQQEIDDLLGRGAVRRSAQEEPR